MNNLYTLNVLKQAMLTIFKKTIHPLYEARIHLPQGCTAAKRRQFTFNHEISRSSRYLYDRTRKDELLSQPWNRDPWTGNPAP